MNITQGDLDYIKAIAHKHAKSHQDGDDIASISLEKIAKNNPDKLEAKRSWMYMIVKRSVINFYRNARPMVSLDDLPQGEYNLREFRLDFEKMTRRLSPMRKKCLRLHCLGYRWTDIAEELNITAPTARANAMGGVKELRRWYGRAL